MSDTKTKPAAKPPAKVDPGAEKRIATAAANASLDIDFSTGKSASDLASEKAQTRGAWATKLAALKEGVETGKGRYDTFYKLGEFSTASGARTVIRTLAAAPEKLPGAFDMEARVVKTAEGTTSELWVAVVEGNGTFVGSED